ncbi:hypothetical protein EU92_1379 [Prochlorococcus marinus str. MIT 9107]|uniref:Uncharacterized protein n=1 Tax=Prochlorococcus marinus str. MIT 9116 TaxID=167544 RepID=A0A0A1ZLU5_PROMR|nr:hypothetical protein EU92_1379 [Prochlorococcus marinus str. MIT 9107]KGF90400.1 hypothetical protein EU93_1571 [Prochlorococcus marinus str. MIT 9116]KGF92879.1 hypothetical protein EU94_1881 [Prochlorococcus marinus str. MIT 9123]
MLQAIITTAHFGDHSYVAGAEAAARNVLIIKIVIFNYSLILLSKKHKIVKGLKSC